MTWEEQALASFKRRGAARELVVAALARQDCCVSAPELAGAVAQRGGRVGIATVYRVLDELAATEHVQRVELGDGITRFERVHRHHHHHVVCNECGRVVPFEDAALERALKRVEKDTGFAVASHDVLLRGACDDCR
jgi:Fur family transcriptional regulator, ferric uptake regulator